ncbi:CDPF1 protein, partial [Chaetops frenatus]|nr:CDPF1 protein [Chaetops frenatus]
MDAPKEIQTPGEFKCELCYLSAPYTYYGWMPPNSPSIMLELLSKKKIKLLEYFSPEEEFSILCILLVTLFSLQDCSLFYSKRFCLPCVKENLKAFTLEIQEGMDKQK